MILLRERSLAFLGVWVPIVIARISEPPILSNSFPASWITTAGFTIANDAWDWQQYLISDGFSGIPSSLFTTCSKDYVGSFLAWASTHASNWPTYSTRTTTETASKSNLTIQTQTFYQPLGEGMGGFNYQYSPPCCGWCQVSAPSVKLYYWQNLTSPNESITSTAMIDDQYTVTYPSAFLAFNSVYTEDRCSYKSTLYTNLGYEIHTDSMFYMLQGVRTSGIGAGNLGYTALPFNFWEQSSLCSSMVARGTSSFNYLHTTISNTKYGFMPCYPAISAPDALFSAVPGWEFCAGRDLWYRGSEDPPHTLTPQPSLATKTAAAPAPSPPPPATATATTSSSVGDLNSTLNPIKGLTSVAVLPQTVSTNPRESEANTQPTSSLSSGSLPALDLGLTTVIVKPTDIPPIPSPEPAGSNIAFSPTFLQLGSATLMMSTDSAGVGELVAGTTTIREAGPAATIDGAVISLGSSDFAIGTRTQSWTASATDRGTENIGGIILSAWTAAGGSTVSPLSISAIDVARGVSSKTTAIQGLTWFTSVTIVLYLI